MRANIPVVVLVWGVGIAACDHPDEYDVTLADYQNQTVYITADEQAVTVVLGEDDGSSTTKACPKIGADLTGYMSTGEFGAVELALISRGGKIGDEPGDDVSDNICGAPTLRLAQPPLDGSSILAISEGKGSIACVLPDLKVARDISADTWDWTTGQTVALQWSPGGELANWSGLSVELVHVNAAGSIDREIAALVTSVANDTITLTVPAFHEDGGSYLVAVSTGNAIACTTGGDQPGRSGAHVTSSLTTFSASHAITLAP